MSVKLFDDWDYIDPEEFESAYREVNELETDDEIDHNELASFMYDERAMAMGDEIMNIDAYLSGHGAAALMVHGSAQRWDGTSHGYGRLYGTFEELMGDTGYDGIFKDCESFAIEDDHGELQVTGIHHDGRVVIDVRPLTPELVDAFREWEDGYDEPSMTLQEIWEKAAKPCIASECYGMPAAIDERIELCTLEGVTIEGEPSGLSSLPATFSNFKEILENARGLWDAGEITKYSISVYDGGKLACEFRPDKFNFEFPADGPYVSEARWRENVRAMLGHEDDPEFSGLMAQRAERLAAIKEAQGIAQDAHEPEGGIDLDAEGLDAKGVSAGISAPDMEQDRAPIAR